ncbi:DUF6273 domain-containing protein [Succinimonas amylolytica]|uniref:DUF6273 domain-containing protein n=1 Tax=Succinimonas amylolytica TaxID=83769 RepID=UPI000368ED4E|nr:DUF6273 domain-containing protein [Succinimonas amylolytica]
MRDLSSRDSGDGFVFCGREYFSLAGLVSEVSRQAQESIARGDAEGAPVFRAFRDLLFSISPENRKLPDIRKFYHLVVRLRESAAREQSDPRCAALAAGYAFPGGDRRIFCGGRWFSGTDDFGSSLIDESLALVPDREYLSRAVRLLFNGNLLSFAEFAEGSQDLVSSLREAGEYISKTPGDSFLPEDPFLNAEPWLQNGVWQALYLGYRLSSVRKFRLGTSIYLSPRDFEESAAVLQKRSTADYQDFLRRHKNALIFLSTAFPEAEARQVLEARLSSITAAVFGNGEYRFRNGTHFNHFVDSLLRRRRYYELRKIFTCYGLGLYEADREVWHTFSYIRLSDALSQGMAIRRLIADIQNRIVNKNNRKPVTVNGVCYEFSDEEIARRKHETQVTEIYYPDGDYPPDYRKPFGGNFLAGLRYLVLLAIICLAGKYTLDHAGRAEKYPEPDVVQSDSDAMPAESRTPAASDIVSFGRYPQSASGAATKLEWYLLSGDDGTLLLLSRKCLDVRPYNQGYSDTYWGTSTINKWLNHEFIRDAFTDREKDALETTAVQDEDISGKRKGVGRYSRDRVFLLSSAEVAQYLKSPDRLLCEITDYARSRLGNRTEFPGRYGSWWLRNRGTKAYSALTVSVNGQVVPQGSEVFSGNVFVRPALRVSRNALRQLRIR